MKVSIICTNYNKGKWIYEAIESFKTRTTFPYEILVADDASTDESVEIIKEYEKKFPTLITAFITKNVGITKTWKSIVKRASGEYIARCDGDDYWTDVHKLQTG